MIRALVLIGSLLAGANHIAFKPHTTNAQLSRRLAGVQIPSSIPKRFAFRVAVAIIITNTGTPPAVTITPSPGSILTPFEPVSVSVTDNLVIRQMVLTVSYPGMNAPEVIFDGTRLTPVYYQGSTFVSTPSTGSNFAFTLVRQGGWIGSPTFSVYASDSAGNVTVP